MAALAVVGSGGSDGGKAKLGGGAMIKNLKQ